MGKPDKTTLQKEIDRLRKLAENLLKPKEQKIDSQFILQPVRIPPAYKYKK